MEEMGNMTEGKANGNERLVIDLLKLADDVVVNKIEKASTKILRNHEMDERMDDRNNSFATQEKR